MRLLPILPGAVVFSAIAFSLNAAHMPNTVTRGAVGEITQAPGPDFHKWCRGGPGQPPTYECESGRR